MSFYTIHPREISSVMFEKKAILIDVRDQEEYAKFHHRGAINCPYDEMEHWKRRFPRGKSLILYCDYGSTSLMAARKLTKEGYEVYTVVGGINAMRRYFKDW